MMRTELPFAVQIGEPDEALPAVYDLAFRAGLDANPRSALIKLQELGVRFGSVLEPDWQFDAESATDRARVLKGLELLGSGMNDGPLRVASSAGALYLGFPESSAQEDAHVLWPVRADAPLRLAPSTTCDAFTNAQKMCDQAIARHAEAVWRAPERMSA
ncbi:hypothetical protein N9H60_04130 [Flavimaricola sp.]|nr:hypothetical protein [Flavimaricola sp.]MDA9020338.1 hypothetical protein [Flavimaricola sp.]